MRKPIWSTNSLKEIRRTLRWLWLTIGGVIVVLLIVAVIIKL